MVSLCWHCGDLDGNETTMKILHGNGGTPLNAIRLSKMGVIASVALEMDKGPY